MANSVTLVIKETRIEIEKGAIVIHDIKDSKKTRIVYMNDAEMMALSDALRNAVKAKR